jgi:hypothetical protein
LIAEDRPRQRGSEYGLRAGEIDALQELDGKADDIGMEEPWRRHRSPDRGNDPEEGPSGTGFWY